MVSDKAVNICLILEMENDDVTSTGTNSVILKKYYQRMVICFIKKIWINTWEEKGKLKEKPSAYN